MSQEEVAAMFRVDQQTIRLWRREGKMPRPVRYPGRRVLFEAAEIERMLAGGLPECKPAEAHRRSEA
jgi:DNA-binding transcriptional MerR regulator